MSQGLRTASTTEPSAWGSPPRSPSGKVQLPGWVGLQLSDHEAEADVGRLFGASADSVRGAWIELYQFALQRADEPVSLSRQLGLTTLD